MWQYNIAQLQVCPYAARQGRIQDFSKVGLHTNESGVTDC